MDAPIVETPQQRQFAREGYLLLRKAVPMDCVEQWERQWADPSFLESLLHQVYLAHKRKSNGDAHAESKCSTSNETMNHTRSYDNAAAMKPGVKHGFREIVMRSPGRYEISLQSLPSTCTHSVLDVVQLHLPWVPSLLQPPASNPLTWQDVQIINVSLVISTPGATEQKWHADGGHVDLHQHQPCHCCNLFIPLCDVTEENGPTELRPGTHFLTRQLVPMMLAAKAKKTLVAPVAPHLQRGDVLLFDYRLLHRGRANQQQDRHRVILVVTVALPWFRDVLNFPKHSIFGPSALR